MSIRLDTPGQTEDTLEKLYISRLAWERLGVLPEELVDVARETNIWIFLLRLL